MAFLKQHQIDEVLSKITTDEATLRKHYKAKKSEYILRSVNHALVDDLLAEGWEEYGKPTKYKTKLRILKPHSQKFEDDIWCQFYELGYRQMNFDENFNLPFGKDDLEKKQIDVVAINHETAFLIECKSSKDLRKAPSYKDEFELLGLRINGFKKAIHQIYGADIKVKFIFATRNLRISENSEDLKRLYRTKSFYYNDNTYTYVSSLLKSYKHAAFYQFLGLVFKHEIINREKIEIPAVRGKMGKKNYYMFSIEPTLLLKMGFILHRTKANESEFPTYQRLLVPSRLKGITKFIDDGGYFPNSIILNFSGSSKKNRIEFKSTSRTSDTRSCYGTLVIPNSYAIAYIIDGQHRLYGYANSQYSESNTIPVVAFEGLDTGEQLNIFMDINENQKAVSPSLKLDLEEDLYWDSERLDSRLKALRSSIIKQLTNLQSGPLFNKISVGEDRSLLTFPPFSKALLNSGLLPKGTSTSFKEGTTKFSLYDITNLDHNNEMLRTRKRIVALLNLCYSLVEDDYPDIYNRDQYFILSNRGTYAFITVIGSLNSFVTEKFNLDLKTPIVDRYEKIKTYLTILLDSIVNLPKDEEEKQLKLLGSGAETKWLRFFQSLIHDKLSEYNPEELIEWREWQDEDLQNSGRKFGVAIEKFMKKEVLCKLKQLFGENWELEINSIKTSCQTRANAENEKNYKEKIDKRVEWTEMFNINDYKTIIEKYWSRSFESDSINEFKTFEQAFSIDIGLGKNKKDRIKWISYFNSYRNLWAHEGSKEKRLNKKEVEFLEMVYNHFHG